MIKRFFFNAKKTSVFFPFYCSRFSGENIVAERTAHGAEGKARSVGLCTETLLESLKTQEWLNISGEAAALFSLYFLEVIL